MVSLLPVPRNLFMCRISMYNVKWVEIMSEHFLNFVRSLKRISHFSKKTILIMQLEKLMNEFERRKKKGCWLTKSLFRSGSYRKSLDGSENCCLTKLTNNPGTVLQRKELNSLENITQNLSQDIQIDWKLSLFQKVMLWSTECIGESRYEYIFNIVK